MEDLSLRLLLLWPRPSLRHLEKLLLRLLTKPEQQKVVSMDENREANLAFNVGKTRVYSY